MRRANKPTLFITFSECNYLQNTAVRVALIENAVCFVNRRSGYKQQWRRSVGWRGVRGEQAGGHGICPKSVPLPRLRIYILVRLNWVITFLWACTDQNVRCFVFFKSNIYVIRWKSFYPLREFYTNRFIRADNVAHGILWRFIIFTVIWILQHNIFRNHIFRIYYW